MFTQTEFDSLMVVFEDKTIKKPENSEKLKILIQAFELFGFIIQKEFYSK